VLRVPLDCSLTAPDAARRLAGQDRPFALIGAWAGGGAVLGCAPAAVAGPDDDPFAVLEEGARLAPGGDGPPALGGDAAPPFVGGGWVGALGYELRQRIEPGHPSPFDAAPPPPFVLARYDHVLRLDPAGRWWFEALPGCADPGAAQARFAALLAAPAPDADARTSDWRLLPGPDGHAAVVAACRERIHAGDLFQANVCARLDGRLEGSALELFARGVEALAPDRAAYLEGPWGAIASLSPELFLERRGRHVRTAPIKGTRPAAGRAELEASAKDRAENTMIVDLMRNDLGRVCVPGTVRVTALAEARAHTGVWHLVSEVEGRLREGTGDGALLRATFPPGSVTGAPKVAAMNVIAELESAARGAYTGAIGFAGPAGLELSVAIRTFEVRGSRIRLGLGGGVVADSDPAAEAEELAVKAAPLLRAIGAAPVPGGRARPGARAVPSGQAARPPLLLPPHVPVARPDPAGGVFATILAEAGRAVALGAQLERLAASVSTLYGHGLPPGLAGDVQAAAAALRTGRVRVDATADGAVSLAPGGPPGGGPIVLRPWTLPGGLGPHKWRDRRLVDALTAASGGAVPLLVDADGAVLEAAWANVFARGSDGVLRTPPADGRILPGIRRAALLAAGAVEAPLTLGDLAAADALLLTSALRAVAARLA
jgi:para-aminobenzoate synthetase/4-amino-4-deoxychorismate lyase